MDAKTALTFKNRKASFDYNILEEVDCGMHFTGNEIKSIRKGEVSLSDNFVVTDKNLDILTTDFTIGNIKRPRHILLKKRMIKKLSLEAAQKGFTIIVLELYENLKLNQFRVKIALVKGNKKYDKRHLLKERDIKREMERERYD